MKQKVAILVLCQAVFTWLQVYFISKISLIGKIGIALAYKEYAFLRSGWKTYLLLFGMQLLVIGILAFTWRRMLPKKLFLTAGVIVLFALIGLWCTYNDFNHTYSHRLLKERFHLGFYLFWCGMISSCVFFVVQPRQLSPLSSSVPNADPGTPKMD